MVFCVVVDVVVIVVVAFAVWIRVTFEFTTLPNVAGPHLSVEGPIRSVCLIVSDSGLFLPLN